MRSRASAQGPELMRAVAAGQAHLGPDETRYLADPEHRREMRELVTHFLGEMLSRGVADAGVVRGEARAGSTGTMPRSLSCYCADVPDREGSPW